jgi:hypothetical protein
MLPRRTQQLVRLARAASSLPQLATRKQHFKEHIWKLQQKDPNRWTSYALAQHFQLPLENVQAMLTLQELEAAAGEIDEDLIGLAGDAEEYLDSEFDDSAAPPPPTSSQKQEESGDGEDVPSLQQLERLSHEHEIALVAAVADRFGAKSPAPGVGIGEALGAALREAVEGLRLEELRALEEQVCGTKGGADGIEESGDGETGERRHALRSLLASLTPDAPESLLEDDSSGGAADHLASLTLRELPADSGAPPPPAASSGSSGSAHAQRGAFSNPSDAFWVDNSVAQPKMRGTGADESGRAPEDGVVARVEGVFGSATTPEAMRSVSEPLLSDTLRTNVERRQRRLAPDAHHYPWRNKGRIIFSDVQRPHRKVPVAARVWVAEKGQGVREPTESEARHAAVRAQPPILKPRIKRNM